MVERQPVEATLVLVRRAVADREVQDENWRAYWAKALQACAEHFSPWTAQSNSLQDGLGEVAHFLSETADMVKDEAKGSKAHFWVPPRNRPPTPAENHKRAAAATILVAACRKQANEAGAGEDPYRLAEKLVRERGGEITVRELRSVVSNASRLPIEERELVDNCREGLESGQVSSRFLIRMYAPVVARK